MSKMVKHEETREGWFVKYEASETIFGFIYLFMGSSISMQSKRNIPSSIITPNCLMSSSLTYGPALAVNLNLSIATYGL